MKHPEKWRDSIDPLSLEITNFKIKEILGYPHAGNDVFHIEGLYKDTLCQAFMKVERHPDANFKNEVEIMNSIDYNLKPKLLAYSYDEPVFVITEEIIGERLSTILNEDQTLTSIEFLEKYGQALAKLHSLDVKCDDVKYRWHFEMNKDEYYQENDLMFLKEFLEINKPTKVNKCFVHGDFHYANVLWNNGEVSGVLDYELSGIGVREFDMAWSVLLRPSQKFLKTISEVELFIQGYGIISDFDKVDFWYYYLLIAGNFYSFGDAEYKEVSRQLMIDALEKYSSYSN